MLHSVQKTYRQSGRRRKRKWIWAAILVLIAGVLLIPVADEVLPFRRARDLAQNAADTAAMGGASQLAKAIQGSPTGEDQIVADMEFYATGSGFDEDDHLVGYYLDAGCDRLGLVGSGIPQDPHGIEAVATVRVRILKIQIWSVSRQGRVCFDLDHTNGQGTPTMRLLLTDD